MSDQPGRFAWLARLAQKWMIGVLVLVGLGLIFTISRMVLELTSAQGTTDILAKLSAYLMAILGELIAAAGAVMVYGFLQLLVAGENSLSAVAAQVTRIEATTQDSASAMKKLADLATLSDQAKSLIYRDRELDAFRERIHADLIHQDYKMAEALLETLEQKLGYADEAARLRDEVAASRKATVDEKIDAAVNRIQEIIDRYDWNTATREMQRLVKAFPQNKKVAALPERFEAARARHKRELLQAYGEAVRKNDVDRSIELLKELDSYLTPQEAAALQDSARGVFRAKLHNLGVQFAINVTDRQWAAAVSVGQEIIQEFPKSRMAQEVREKMEQLQARAAGKAEKNDKTEKAS